MAQPSRLGLFLFCAGGIYAFYLTYAIVQEHIYMTRSDGTRFGATWLLICVQCAMHVVFAQLGAVLFQTVVGSGSGLSNGDRPDLQLASFPFRSWTAQKAVAAASATYLLAMFCSNEALKHVNYPTQALGKSCKLIPVLLGRVLIVKAHYPVMKYVCVVLMTIGIIVFQLGGEKTSGGFGGTTLGFALLFLSLAFDGATGSLQEKVNSRYRLSNSGLMTLTNLWATLYTLVIATATGDLSMGVS